MALEVRRMSVSGLETQDISPPSSDLVVAPMSPPFPSGGSSEESERPFVARTARTMTILHPDAARDCVESGGRLDPVRGCVMDEEEEEEVPRWVWVLGGAVLLGLGYFALRG